MLQGEQAASGWIRPLRYRLKQGMPVETRSVSPYYLWKERSGP